MVAKPHFQKKWLKSSGSHDPSDILLNIYLGKPCIVLESNWQSLKLDLFEIDFFIYTL